MKLPSPAMSVSVAALVVALGGTSYAAVTVNGANIKAKSIDSSKIKKDTLGSGVIKDGKVKGKDLAPDAKVRWALIGKDGQIALQSGGFTVVAPYPTLANTATDGTDNSQRAAGNVYINAGEDLAGNGLGATLTLQNTVDVDGGGMAGRTDVDPTRNGGRFANPEFSGEITVSRCNPGAPTTPPVGPTNCAPTDAQNVNSFVVSPRNSDGTVTTPATRKAFYVFVTTN